jgi:hypothetical protein
MLALLLLLASQGFAAGVSCPNKEKMIQDIRRKYAAAQKVKWRQKDAKEFLCGDFHITAYYKDGLLAQLREHRNDSSVYLRDYYFEKGKLYFGFEKRFSRSEENGAVTETRLYAGPDCAVERTRVKEPRGLGHDIADFDLSRVPDEEEILPASAAGPWQRKAAKAELKIEEYCPPDKRP